jgi:hypothetical protein
VEYLGHICTSQGIRPDPKKIRAIEEYPVPKTVRDIRAFIGLAGYYRRHVPNFAELAKPLTTLTKKEIPFKMEEGTARGFRHVKTNFKYCAFITLSGLLPAVYRRLRRID